MKKFFYNLALLGSAIAIYSGIGGITFNVSHFIDLLLASVIVSLLYPRY